MCIENSALESYTKAAIRLKRHEPIGMFVMRMLWFTGALFGPNNSEVMDTASEKTKPELKPNMPVLILRHASLSEATSRANANGVGTMAMVYHPVLGKCMFQLHYFKDTIRGLVIMKCAHACKLSHIYLLIGLVSLRFSDLDANESKFQNHQIGYILTLKGNDHILLFK